MHMRENDYLCGMITMHPIPFAKLAELKAGYGEPDVRIPEIVSYLKLSHRYYVEVAMTGLETQVRRVLASCDEKRGKVILSFFESYREEMMRHFAYEEEKVFPYAEALMKGASTEDISIEEEDHTDIVEKVDDFYNIVAKYLPAECDPMDALILLKQLSALSEDLKKHTYVEDHLLIPRMRRMEWDGK